MSQAHPECLRAFEAGQKDPEEGLRILDDLLSREPNAVAVFNVYGQLSLKRGDLATAGEAFARNIAASPESDHRFDWAYLGLIAGLLGDDAKARECASKAGTIQLQYSFANGVREAYSAWLRQKGHTPSRLA